MLGLAALVTTLACGSAEGPTSLLDISPMSPEVEPSGNVQFNATSPAAQDERIAWAVVEPDGGTIDTAGTYTAPESEGTYTVTASLASLSTSQATSVRVKRNIRVDVSPSGATIAAGESLALSASVTGAVKTVTWSIAEGAAGGTVTAEGVYTSPETAGVYHVVATSTADPTKSGIAAITVTATLPAPPPPPTVSIAVSPQTAAVNAGATMQFTGTVTGTTDGGVTWSVLESGGGAVSSTGLYTAPLSAGTYHVVAKSVADATKSATATVTVTAVSVAVSPQTASVAAGNTMQFAAAVTGSTNGAVTWAVLESGAGTVNSAGLYTAPPTAGTYHVVAKSVADPTKSATATVTATAPTPPPAPLPQTLAAFPGCQGGGCFTRGGFSTSAGTPRIYRVTSLATGTGPGTLGECIAASGPRVCTFAVAGTIRGPNYTITNPHITIRGDTAPGMGIMLANDGVTAGDVIRVRTSNVVIRGLRLRDGNAGSATNNSSHAFSIYPTSAPTNHIVLDHMSFSWGNDETFDIYSAGAQPPAYQPRDITLSHVIIGEGLWRTTGQAMGALIAGDSADHTLADAMTDIDIHHSFFANNYKRNPELRIARGRFINNILYNWGSGAATFDDGMEADLINNLGRFGPNTADYTYREMFRVGFFTNTAASGAQSVHLSGNKYHGGAVQGWGTGLVRNAGTVTQRSTPLAPAASGPAIVPEATDAIATSVAGAGGAGHSRRLDCGGRWVTAGVRDSVDTRLANSFLNPPTYYAFAGCTGTGCWPRIAADVGGFPAITPIAATTVCSPSSRDNTSCVCADSDADGMPDYWERSFCGAASGTSSCSALGTTVAAPWTNLEAFQSGSVIAP